LQGASRQKPDGTRWHQQDHPVEEVRWWKKCAPSGNFAHAKTFPVRHAGANYVTGLFIHS
jgi:hypothetical protein